MANELATLAKQESGDLRVTITREGQSLVAQRTGEGMQSDDAILGELLEYDLCNGWGLCYADELGALSTAPVLYECGDLDKQGRPTVEDGHWWYFEPYQVRSAVTDLMRYGEAIFTKGE